MSDTVISFPCGAIGLVVRGKQAPAHHPGLMAQHADCILHDGSPIGFFGQQGAGSGAVSANSSSGSGGSARNSTGSSNSSGLNMKGIVYDLETLRRFRLQYVELAVAERNRVVSTVLIVTVSDSEAQVFERFWRDLDAKPGTFNLLGSNCSSHAAEAFASAGIIPAEIPGLDTPDNLYDHLLKRLPSRCTSYSGFVGFERQPTGGFQVTIRAAVS